MPDLIAHLQKLPGAPTMINPSPAHIVTELLTTIADMATAKPCFQTYLESGGTVILSQHQILAATSWDALAFKLIRDERASIPPNNSKCTYSPIARQVEFAKARKKVIIANTPVMEAVDPNHPTNAENATHATKLQAYQKTVISGDWAPETSEMLRRRSYSTRPSSRSSVQTSQQVYIL